MRYPLQTLLVVSDAERAIAQQLAVAELGPVRGADWYAARLEDAEGNVFWASSSAMTDANLATIQWFQSTPASLSSLVYVARDRRLGEELDAEGELALLGLTPAPLAAPDPEPAE